MKNIACKEFVIPVNFTINIINIINILFYFGYPWNHLILLIFDIYKKYPIVVNLVKY